MRYMHKKIYFNKSELQELEKRNPTLFNLAKYVADKAHITARVMGENWINVNTNDDYKDLLCPSAVFHVPENTTAIVRYNQVGSVTVIVCIMLHPPYSLFLVVKLNRNVGMSICELGNNLRYGLVPSVQSQEFNVVAVEQVLR